MGSSEKGSKTDRLIAIIGAAAGVGAMVISAMAYLHPSDVNHPPKIDFIYNKVAIPLWLFAAGVLAILGIIAFLINRIVKSPPLPATRVDQPSGGIQQTTASRDSVRAHAPEPSPPKPTEPESATPPFSIAGLEHIGARRGDGFSETSEDHLAFHLTAEAHGDTVGFMLRIRNDGLKAISEIAVVIYTARGFDQKLKDFRDGIEFNAVRLTGFGMIGAGSTGNAKWLVAKKEGQAHLFVGDNTATLLRWPPNDQSTFQKWRIKLAVLASLHPSGATKAAPLKPIKLILDIGWDMKENTFSIEGAGTFAD
jgi:hypothetical protein